MAKFLKIDLKTYPLNFVEVFLDDYNKDADAFEYWTSKGIDWEYVLDNSETMGYSITKAYDDNTSFFLLPYLEDKYDILEAIIEGKEEVAKYIILDEAEAKETFLT